MEFKDYLKERISEAKKIAYDVDNLSEKEKEIVFSKMVDKILDSKEIRKKENFPQHSNLNYEDKTERDLQEIYHELKPKTGPDNVLLIAYHYYTKNQSFAVKHLLENYKLLLIPAPLNPSDLINKNRTKGFVMLDGKDEKKNNLFSITRKGLSYVKNGFKEIKDE